MARYSTALSYVILTAVGVYSSLSLAKYNFYFAKLSFGIITLTSLIGTWRWGNPIYGYKVDKIYAAVTKVEDMLALACVVACVWMKYKFPFLIALGHILVAFLPLVIHIYDVKKNKIIDYCIGANIFSLICISLVNGNYYGVSTALSYILTHYCIKRDLFLHIPLDAPTMDILNYSMCFFTVFALKAVLDPIM